MHTRRMVLGLVVLLASTGPARAVDDEDLKRYGFSRDFAGELEESRRFELPQPDVRTSVPSPVVPGDLLDPSKVPGAPEYVTRVIRQRRDAPTPGVEGPVAVFPGDEQAIAEEGTFREVEDFFFRPDQLHRRIFSMTEDGWTGLITMPTAEIPRPGSTFVRAGVSYTLYNQASGENLQFDQGIEQVLAPVTYQSVPWKDLELSLQVMGVSEDNNGFPLIPDYQLAGVREVGVNAKYRFLNNPASNLQAAFGFGLRVGVERDPSRIGSNGVDYEMFLAATKHIDNWAVHLRGGLVFPNGEDRSNSGVPEISKLGVGFDFAPSNKLTVLGEVNYLDWNFVGNVAEGVIGFKYRLTDQFTFDFGVPLELDNTLVEGWRWRVLGSVQARL